MRLKVIEEYLNRLFDEFLTFLPERLCIFRIEPTSTYTFADGDDGRGTVLPTCVAC
jgi:hypothetical protein